MKKKVEVNQSVEYMKKCTDFIKTYNSPAFIQSDFKLSNSMQRALFNSRIKLMYLLLQTFFTRNEVDLMLYNIVSKEKTIDIIKDYLFDAKYCCERDKYAKFKTKTTEVLDKLSAEDINSFLKYFTLMDGTSAAENSYVIQVGVMLYDMKAELPVISTLDLLLMILSDPVDGPRIRLDPFEGKRSTLHYIYGELYPSTAEYLDGLSANDSLSFLNRANQQGFNMEFSLAYNLQGYNTLYSTYVWKRDNFNDPDNRNAIFELNQALSLLNVPDVLKYRRFYIREKGVIIKFKKEFDGIKQIFCKEEHSDSRHYIKIIYSTESHDRVLVLNMKDWYAGTKSFLYEIDYIVLAFFFNWVGVTDVFKDKYDVFSDRDFKVIERNTGKHLSETKKRTYEKYFEYAMEYLDNLSDVADEKNLIYVDPQSWNYSGMHCGDIKDASTKDTDEDNSSSQEAKSKKIAVGEVEVTVGCYMRKLPAGYSASADAIDKAKAKFMELKEGYTFVDEFTRKRTVYASKEERVKHKEEKRREQLRQMEEAQREPTKFFST